MKKYVQWFAAIAVAGALAGCARTAPVEQIQTAVSAGHTEDQVKQAILRAGVQRQWIMSQTAPGAIAARQQLATMSLRSVLITPPAVILFTTSAAAI